MEPRMRLMYPENAAGMDPFTLRRGSSGNTTSRPRPRRPRGTSQSPAAHKHAGCARDTMLRRGSSLHVTNYLARGKVSRKDRAADPPRSSRLAFLRLEGLTPFRARRIMKLHDTQFDITDWSTIPPTEHPGVTGKAL